MSIFIWRVCCFWSSNANAIDRLFMKLLIHFFSCMNKFNLITIINNWFVETWSNVFLTFNNKHDVINFCFKISWISCIKLNIALIADRFFRSSIWSKSSIFDICFKYDNRLTMIFFEIFFKQFNKIMIQYDFDIIFLFFYWFRFIVRMRSILVMTDLLTKYNKFRIFLIIQL